MSVARYPLHHRVIDRIGRTRRKRLFFGTEEQPVMRAGGVRDAAGIGDVGPEPLDLLQPCRSAHHEHPAVPQELLRRQHRPRRLLIRLLDELLQLER